MREVTPLKPYLLRAVNDWIQANGLTPYILVRVSSGVNVPEQHVRNGEVTLNIAQRAVRGLELGDEYISFSARFGGVSRDIFVPIEAVVAIYAQENGRGMVFDEVSQGESHSGDEDDGPKTPPKSSRPTLKIVK